jgi:hypothetical protein
VGDLGYLRDRLDRGREEAVTQENARQVEARRGAEDSSWEKS